MSPEDRKLVGELVRRAKLQRMEALGYRICASLSCDQEFEIGSRKSRRYCSRVCAKKADDARRHNKPRSEAARARDLAAKRERYYKKRQENPKLSGREAHRITG